MSKKLRFRGIQIQFSSLYLSLCQSIALMETSGAIPGRKFPCTLLQRKDWALWISTVVRLMTVKWKFSSVEVVEFVHLSNGGLNLTGILWIKSPLQQWYGDWTLGRTAEYTLIAWLWCCLPTWDKDIRNWQLISQITGQCSLLWSQSAPVD